MAYTVRETIVTSKSYNLADLPLRDWPLSALQDARRLLAIPRHYHYMSDKENHSLAERKAYLVKLVEAQNEMLPLSIADLFGQ